MPTYEYVCRSCDHRFEKRQSFSAKPLRTCPECGQKSLQKVIFPTGVVFKGSGFYVTDSKAKPPSKKPGSADSGSEKTAKSGKSDSEKKSAKVTSDD